MSREEILLTEIKVYLKKFVTILNKPQFTHFEQIIKRMLFNDLKSINSYSKSSKKNQSSLNRFMNSKVVNNVKIKQLLVDFIESKLNSKKEKDFIFDDTLKRYKYAEHIYGLSSHHDHLNGGYFLSYNLVIGEIRQEGFFYPTDCELYQRQVDMSESSTFVTKIDMALALLDKWFDKVDNVLMDDRWPIETFYKDIKQNLGFEKCIIRKEIGIKRHFLMSFIVHNLLIFSKKKQISCGETQRNLKYSYIENVLQNYNLPSHNLEECKKELMILY